MVRHIACTVDGVYRFGRFTKNVITMKYYYYGSAICWLSYGVAIESMAAILYDIIGIVALSYSLYQLKIIEQKAA